MKKTIAIICENDNVEEFWLKHNVSIFIESKIVNENYGNFIFTSENNFDTFIVNILRDLDLKTNCSYCTKDKNARLYLTYDFTKTVRTTNIINENLDEYLLKNTDFIIFYVKNEKKYLKNAKEKNINYINFY